MTAWVPEKWVPQLARDGRPRAKLADQGAYVWGMASYGTWQISGLGKWQIAPDQPVGVVLETHDDGPISWRTAFGEE